MRPVHWYDWPFIFRHRRKIRSLDNILGLTRGGTLTWVQMLANIRPTEHVFTGVFEPDQDGTKLIGQVHKSQHASSAYISYMVQSKDNDGHDLIALLEGLIKQAGRWGAKQVVADLESGSDWFPLFRQAGFSVLSEQRVYQVKDRDEIHSGLPRCWRIWSEADISAMRSLYMTLVPPMIQTVEPLTRREMLGLVHYDDRGELQAYADMVYGPRGAWVLPLIHPQTRESITAMLARMIQDLPQLNGRKIFVVSRSYQPWVEHALADLPLEPGPQQALLVRYMAMRQRVKAELSFKALENGKGEPSIPIYPLINQRNGNGCEG